MPSMKTIFEGYLQMSWPRIKWVFLFSIFFYFLFCVWKKLRLIKRYENKYIGIFVKILLAVECSFIFIMTLFGRKFSADYKSNLVPFESYWKAISNRDAEMILQIIMNVAMYIPLGLLLPCCFRLFEKYRYVILIAFCGSLMIELIQLVFRLGLFEVDDVINNTLGAVIGVSIYALSNILRGNRIGKLEES